MRREISALGVRRETSTLGVKKIIVIILGWLIFLSGLDMSFAIWDPNSFSSEEATDTAARMDAGSTTTATSWDNSVGNEAEWGDGWGGGTTVIVTEEIPGMKCSREGSGSGPDKKKYKCTIQSWFGSVMAILSGLIKYATFITALVGVLMLVVSGIQYSMAGAEKSAAEDAKKRIQKTILGLVLLFLVGFILNTVAPWIYR